MSEARRKYWTQAMARPFRLTAPVIGETDLHEAVAQLLAKVLMPEVEWTTFPAGNVPLAREYASKLSRLGLQRGWPDIVLLFEGRIYGLEIKKPGGVLSRTRIVRTRSGAPRELIGQVDRFARLRAAGMTIEVVNSVDQAISVLYSWGLPLRWKPSETRL
jgi:hypothetical protein